MKFISQQLQGGNSLISQRSSLQKSNVCIKPSQMEGRFKKSFSVIMVSKVKLNEYKNLILTGSNSFTIHLLHLIIMDFLLRIWRMSCKSLISVLC